MKSPETDLTFMVPLSYEAHQIAEQHFQQPKRFKQAYLNSLAVYAVGYYLRCLGWQTARQSDSSNPLLQQFIDSADLQVLGLGRLECRPVLPDSTVCEIPTEVWQDRIGYVAVQFDQSLRQAEILGFVQFPAPAIPLDQLQPLDDLLIYLDRLQPSAEPPQPIRLLQWLDNIFTAGWQVMEELWSEPQPELVFRHEANRPTIAKGFKVIHLGSDVAEMILVITQRLAEDEQIDIQVELQPGTEQSFLPVGLQIAVLDGQGKSFLTAETRTENPSVHLEFSGERGDAFSISMTLGENSGSESFLL